MNLIMKCARFLALVIPGLWLAVPGLTDDGALSSWGVLVRIRVRADCRHAALVALRHCAAASDRKIRSVDRETRWRWRLKVLWTAACTLRKRCADAADLKRCILRSRRRTT
jgi:hypothetical protein